MVNNALASLLTLKNTGQLKSLKDIVEDFFATIENSIANK